MSTFRRSSAWWLRAWRSACPPCLPRGPRPFEPAEPPRAVWIIAWSHPNPSVTSWPRAMWRCSACRIPDSRPEVTTRRPGRLPGTTEPHCQADDAVRQTRGERNDAQVGGHPDGGSPHPGDRGTGSGRRERLELERDGGRRERRVVHGERVRLRLFRNGLRLWGLGRVPGRVRRVGSL